MKFWQSLAFTETDQLVETAKIVEEVGFEGAFVELRAPEGTTLYAFDEDFLGESYVVDESDELPDGFKSK